MEAKTIYELGLGDSTSFSHGFLIRVPGGWLYTEEAFGDRGICACFVPYHDEFLPIELEPIEGEK